MGKGANGGKANQNGENATGGVIMIFYKTNNPVTGKIQQQFKPFLNIYNYNPLTGLMPGDTTSDSNENWIYYKYQNDYDNNKVEFNHTITNEKDKNIWILCVGPGGIGGGHKDNKGGGGGGGTGEVRIDCLDITTVASKLIKLYIGPKNTETSPEDNNNNYNSETGASTYVKYTSTSGTANTLLATGGFQGIKADTEEGAEGGQGGGYRTANNQQVMTTFDTSNSSTFKFGSGGGGGGYGVHSNNGDIGNQTWPYLNSGTKWDYKWLDRQANQKSGDSVYVDFNISLKSIKCDNTGSGKAAQGGSGGDAKQNGFDGPNGYIIIFHKTTSKLTKTFTSHSQAYFGVNPKTGYIPPHTNCITEKAYFYTGSGSTNINGSDFNKMFNLTSSSSAKPNYLAVGGGGGGGSYFYNEYYSVGGGGGGGGQPLYGNIEYQDTSKSLNFTVGGNGDFGGNADFNKLGKDGTKGSDTTITLTNGTVITAKGGGGGSKAYSSDYQEMGLAGYGGGMGSRVKQAPTGVTQTGPAGGFGTYSEMKLSGSRTYEASADYNWYDLGEDSGDDDSFTYYQQIKSNNFEHKKNYITDEDWQNGCFMNLKLSSNDKQFFSGTTFEVSRGGDAGKDDLKGASKGEADFDRDKYQGAKGSSGHILVYGFGPSGPII